MRSVTRLFAAVAVVLLAISGCSVIRGDKTAGTAIDDTTLTARIKTALAADPTAAASRVDVDVDKGRVTLTGTAKNPEEARRAEDIARRVPGVKAVESHIRVAEADSRSRSPG
jgi:hyperosmotically inducible protein